MLQFHIRVWRTRGVYANTAAFRRVINKGMINEVAPLLEASMQKRVATWKEPPQFKALHFVTAKGIRLKMIPLGPGAQKWKWVSWGVKGRWRSVKKTSTFRGYKGYRPALRLRRYAPRTFPGGFFSGPGLKYGPVAYRRRVWWPGITPRYFEKDIINEFRRTYYRVLENIVRRAVRRAQREGA